MALASLGKVNASTTVLDLGAGLGGPARCLAQALGCHVMALEVSKPLVEQGRALTERLGLSCLVTHVCGEACQARLEDPVDVVWIQHVDMQIPDKLGFYRNAAACLSNQGRIAWHDWLAGPEGPPFYPLMWSADGSMSFLSDEGEFRSNIEAAGLRLEEFQTLGQKTQGWFGKTLTAVTMALSRESQDSPRRLRLERLDQELRNVLSSIAQKRLVPFFAIARPRCGGVK
jgi:SAM-dependent methyltransferase